MGLRTRLGWFLLLALLTPVRSVPGFEPVSPAVADPAACRVPLEALGAVERERVRAALDRPTLVSRGPVEVFACRSDQYHWLLDHPDQAARLWHCLGVKTADIRDQGGFFRWEDGKGSH